MDINEKNNGNDTNVGSMENSIEDRINKAYCFLNSMHSDFRTGLYYKEDLENLEHILSDYKKLQEEFKQVDHECERLEEKEVRLIKENEELKNKLLDTLEGQKVIKEETPQYIKENYIPIQKIKDKIKEILKNGEYRIIFEGDAEFPDEATRIDAQKYIKLERFQELLELESEV